MVTVNNCPACGAPLPVSKSGTFMVTCKFCGHQVLADSLHKDNPTTSQEAGPFYQPDPAPSYSPDWGKTTPTPNHADQANATLAEIEKQIPPDTAVLMQRAGRITRWILFGVFGMVAICIALTFIIFALANVSGH